MTRLLAFQIALLLAPFAVFLLYRLAMARLGSGRERPLNETPFAVLLLLGAVSVVAAASVMVWRQDPPSHAGEVYLPPVFEDGERIPGRWISREEAIERGLISPTYQDGRSDSSNRPDTDPFSEPDQAGSGDDTP